MAKAIASRYVEIQKPTTKFSATPSTSPPMTAPGMIQIPPSTAAMKALSPGINPIIGSAVL